MRGILKLLEPIRILLPGRQPERSTQAQSLLLNLPIELLLEISGLLSLGSAVAFALTCTFLFNILFPKIKLHGIQLEELLQLLERDLSEQLFFCQRCYTLHRFSPSWGPGRQDHFEAPCKPKVEVCDTFHLGFHFARLAVNKHLLGGGLNLEQLTTTLPNYNGGWDIRCTARVVQNELYLSVSHRLSLNGTGPDNRHALERLDHGICHHVTTHRPKARLNLSTRPRGRIAYEQWLQQRRFYAVPQRTRIQELAPSDYPTYSHALAECRDAQGSCTVCLTDYSVTINQTKSSEDSSETAKESWDIIIIAYHQLGPCRSQFDWKWLTYATELPTLSKQNMDTSLLGKRCENGPYARGAVQARWDRS